MLLVAYPFQNENDTILEFEYWIDGYTPSLLSRIEKFLKYDNNW